MSLEKSRCWLVGVEFKNPPDTI